MTIPMFEWKEKALDGIDIDKVNSDIAGHLKEKTIVTPAMMNPASHENKPSYHLWTSLKIETAKD